MSARGGDRDRELIAGLRNGPPHWNSLVPIHQRDQDQKVHIMGYQDRRFDTGYSGLCIDDQELL